eukprot:scaffold646_cov367-Prasinococcus_capsulatus_cf.AAC.7
MSRRGAGARRGAPARARGGPAHTGGQLREGVTLAPAGGRNTPRNGRNGHPHGAGLKVAPSSRFGRVCGGLRGVGIASSAGSRTGGPRRGGSGTVLARPRQRRPEPRQIFLFSRCAGDDWRPAAQSWAPSTYTSARPRCCGRGSDGPQAAAASAAAPRSWMGPWRPTVP